MVKSQYYDTTLAMFHLWLQSQGAEKSWEGLGRRSSQGGTIPSKLVLQIKVGNTLSKVVPICLTIICQEIPICYCREVGKDRFVWLGCVGIGGEREIVGQG